jgi:hypothetical protein
MYIASVRNKATNKIEVIEKDYDNKKDFEIDLRGNGYRIRFITTPEKFDEACEKYHNACEKSKMYHRIHREVEKYAAELRK